MGILPPNSKKNIKIERKGMIEKKKNRKGKDGEWKRAERKYGEGMNYEEKGIKWKDEEVKG